MHFKPSLVFIAVTAALTSTGISAATYTEAITAVGEDSAVSKTDQNIVIEVAQGSDAVLAQNGGHVVLGGEQTETITIDSLASDDAVSALTTDKTPGTTVDITANQSVVIQSTSYGLWAQSGTQETQSPEGSAEINISANEISISSEKSTISAFSNSIVNLNADRISLSSQNGTAIDVRGNSTVNLGNADGTAVLTINGDIVFETPNQVPDGDSVNSGDKLNAYVSLNLTEGSSWTGRAYQLFPVKNTEGEWVENNTVALEDDRHPNYGFITGFTVNIDNGGVWNMTGDSFVNNATVNDGGVVNVTKDVKTVHAGSLDLNGGVFNLQGSSEQKVNVVSLTGTGGTVNAATTVGTDGKLATASMNVESVATGEDAPVMTVNYTGITSDQLTNENVDDLKAVSVAEGEGEVSTLSTIENVDEGDIRGKWTRTTRAADGTPSAEFARNTKLEDFSAVNAMTLVQWRNEINHLTKRLGDIRASESAVGAWARVYGGTSEWGDNSAVEMDHTTIQVGGDYRINPHWIVGGAFSYTDSDADLVNGQAEGESYSLAAYATWMGETGSYLDMIARYGHLKNDISAGNMVLDTSSNAFSLSFEGGHQFRFMERAYVEPQIEVTYGFISGDDATASNGVKVEQDDYQNLITRVGLRTGFDFPEKAGTIYAMLSYSYDFLGDADGTATKDGLHEDLNEDLGGGWVSYGVGAQFKLGDNAFAYGELERTSGGDIDNPYLFNVGMRWNF